MPAEEDIMKNKEKEQLSREIGEKELAYPLTIFLYMVDYGRLFNLDKYKVAFKSSRKITQIFHSNSNIDFKKKTDSKIWLLNSKSFTLHSRNSVSLSIFCVSRVPQPGHKSILGSNTAIANDNASVGVLMIMIISIF